MTENQQSGLTTQEAIKQQQIYGKNELVPRKNQSFIKKILHIISEPMFILLLVTALIYFALGEPRDGLIMLLFVLGIIGIDIIQQWKTDKTLSALKDMSEPFATVIRDGRETNIPSVELVPGDLILISEGEKIPADGEIIKSSDLRVDESSLTGETEGVWKLPRAEVRNQDDTWRKDYCYAGTHVLQGSGYVLVDKIGLSTQYGKIGATVASAPESDTPLQKQTNSLVRLCACIAGVLIVLVGLTTYLNISDHAFKDRLVESILSGITIAMATIPEEFPVILTVFLSMGAWRLAKKHSLVRKLSSVETLGSVSVLCVDKTGTITMNQMKVKEVWSPEGNNCRLCETMGLGCEAEAYDPMEKAMLEYCGELGISTEHIFGGEMLREYAFTNELKMMGHVWRHDGEIIIAAKGSPEKILSLCPLDDAARVSAEMVIDGMSRQGLRVIAVGIMKPENEAEIPKEITGCSLEFLGVVGLYDPPRPSVAENVRKCIKAGIRVVMITGDNGITAGSIAGQVGIVDSDKLLTGAEINDLSDEQLREVVKTTNIFSRVVPEHKMRIVKAFKDNGEIVAMTGDGVNDAPALKYADIGIAMGKRGSQVSREAADIILMDDNFSTIVDTVEDGRRIYDNIRNAVGYVLTLHIPIALSALVAPLLKINPASLLLLPLHVVILELLIDPTCSIVMERQPAEKNIMEHPPRDPKEKILTSGSLTKSLLQGLAIFAASFFTYLFYLGQGAGSAELARTMGLSIIILANLFLVFENSSKRDFIFKTIRLLLHDKVMWAIIIGTLLGLAAILYTPVSVALKLTPLSVTQLLTCLGIALASVLWYELVKLANKLRAE